MAVAEATGRWPAQLDPAVALASRCTRLVAVADVAARVVPKIGAAVAVAVPVQPAQMQFPLAAMVAAGDLHQSQV